jgi:hypothetical protein
MHIAYFPYLGTFTWHTFPIEWLYNHMMEVKPRPVDSPSTCYWLIPGTED